MPSTSKHGLARGLPLKEVLEYLVPELNVHCLRLALNTPKVTDQLMKLDEQGVRTAVDTDLHAAALSGDLLVLVERRRRRKTSLLKGEYK